MNLRNLKIAIVCDWLTTAGGAEKVILGLHQLFPNAPIYTSVYNPEKVKGFEKAEIHTSFLQKIPLARKKHQYFLQFMPKIFESFDLSEYDIVISSSHSCAKGIIVKPETLHISYCHSPMRYAWDGHHQYINEYKINSFVKKFVPFFIHNIRIWDRMSADRVDTFIANSNYVKNRIHKYYRKDSHVIHPFLDNKNYISTNQREDFFLAVGRLTSYKRFDLIVDTFNQLDYKIKIAGTGNMMNALKAKSKKNIEFLGYVSDHELLKLYSKAKALIFPQIEDFGIIPLESMASGCPVIAFKKGGALETVIDGKTGTFFDEQSVDSLKNAIYNFQTMDFNTNEIIEHANSFRQKHFNEKFLNLLQSEWERLNN
ncbi:glycosyltransferase [Candidatus Peregrinibacteria bacterium]|nr:glycosyltransferase [Candidatus Peregrinibacteria bacterium]